MIFFVCISFSMNYKIDIGGKCYAIPTHLLPLRAKCGPHVQSSQNRSYTLPVHRRRARKRMPYTGQYGTFSMPVRTRGISNNRNAEVINRDTHII